MKTLYLSIFLLLFIIPAMAKDTIYIGRFSSADMEGWKEKRFSSSTRYHIALLENTQVLKAESHEAASGLFKEQQIDITKTPYLTWRWRIENRLGDIDEQSKSGDDYSARIYVVVSGGWAFWKTKAINYVWASNMPKGKNWPNAFAGKNAMMISLRSSADKTQHWYQEKRNIVQDFKTQFGVDVDYIDAIAIMTDTDNAKGNTTAYYGDIFFSSK